MSLSPHDIQRLATLSRLPFDEAQAERIRGQLNGFFAIVEQMRDDEARHATTAINHGGAELPAPVKAAMRLSSKLMTKTAYRV